MKRRSILALGAMAAPAALLRADVNYYPYPPRGESGRSLVYPSNAGLYQTSGGSTPASANNDPVGRWEDASGNARNLIQAAAGSRPLLQTASPSIKFDGTDDVLSYSGVLADTVGTLLISFQTGATAFATRGAQVLFSSSDVDAANNWFEVGIGADGRMYVESNAAGTKHTVVATTFLDVSSQYFAALVHDGTDYYMEVEGVEQNPLTITNVGAFAWIGDVASQDTISLGATITSAGTQRPFQGEILRFVLYDRDIS